MTSNPVTIAKAKTASAMEKTQRKEHDHVQNVKAHVLTDSVSNAEENHSPTFPDMKHSSKKSKDIAIATLYQTFANKLFGGMA
jgi:phosphorylcholine metabolism protein LicD